MFSGILVSVSSGVRGVGLAEGLGDGLGDIEELGLGVGLGLELVSGFTDVASGLELGSGVAVGSGLTAGSGLELGSMVGLELVIVDVLTPLDRKLHEPRSRQQQIPQVSITKAFFIENSLLLTARTC
ncbi:hypothetical protein WDW86_15425 [Bdellovibrionota bacterium FG-2]